MHGPFTLWFRLWFRVGSFSELNFIFFLIQQFKKLIQVLINIIIISEVLEHMFYSIKMANIGPFRCPKNSFRSFSVG